MCTNRIKSKFCKISVHYSVVIIMTLFVWMGSVWFFSAMVEMVEKMATPDLEKQMPNNYIFVVGVYCRDAMLEIDF